MSITFKSSLTFAAAVLTSAVLVSSAALASAPTEPVVVTATRNAEVETRHVSYRDLDLVQAGDQRRLDRRVDVAIKDVCAVSDYYDVRTLSSRAAYLTCSDFAWNGARPQITAAIANAMTGGSVVASISIAAPARAGG